GRSPVEFQSCTYWWLVRRCSRDRARKLVGVEMAQRTLAEGGCSDDYIAAGRFLSRRSSDVRAFCDFPSFYTGGGPVRFRQITNFLCGLDGAFIRHQRCAKNDGHHYHSAFYWEESGEFRSLA